MEHDTATLVRVSRDGDELGQFYLSFVELSLKNQTFRESDLGWTSGMEGWDALPTVVRSIRSTVGKKTGITSGQRTYLKRCGLSLWTGMSNREASAIIEKLQEQYEIPPGEWLNEPATKAQEELMNGLGSPFSKEWTKGQASLAISARLIELAKTEAKQ